MDHQDSPTRLKRTLNLPLLTLYGLGSVIGAGIYALVGEIAGVAGYGSPLSFLVAAVVAGFTACSFAELAGRFPRAAGAALYVQRGFDAPQLALAVGLLVTLAGTVSSAALVNAFAGYFISYVTAPQTAVIAATALALAGIAAWGIAQSVAVAATITVVEIGGLVVVIALGMPSLAELPAHAGDFLPAPVGDTDVGSILLGVTLAFYAFIGFEDMIDVAEEVKDVRLTMPRAILLTLGVSTVLYVLLMTTALTTLTPAELAAAGAPLAELFRAHTGGSGLTMGIIAMFAILNGALVQIVMASRVLYGLSSRGQLPAFLCRVHAGTRTPLVATAIAGAAVLALALIGNLGDLAGTTSLLMLVVFAVVNLALWRIKGREGAPTGCYEFPRFMPAVGFVLSGALVVRELWLLVA